MTGTIRLERRGEIALITNDNPDKHNAFDDLMDLRLFEILAELRTWTDLRAVIWRGDGPSFSSGRDVGSIGGQRVDISHAELMRRGHVGIANIFQLDAPIIVALHGWAIGGAFQRALLCDIRIAADDARFKLPEVAHGVIPDTGGVARLYQMCGHGVVADMALTGRTMSAHEALGHGVVSRLVPRVELDTLAWSLAEKIAAAPATTIRMARRVISNLSEPALRASMDEEMIAQTFVTQSADYLAFRRRKIETSAG